MEKEEFIQRKKKVKKTYKLKRLSFKKSKGKNIDNDKTIIKSINNNAKKVKARNPGVDFVRIISMYAIIIHHIIVHGGLFNKYNQYKELILMNISTYWHVSCYALISGYIGYKSNKYSNLLYLSLWTIFYSSLITYYMNKYRPKFYTRKLIYKDFFPVIFEAYWYFTKYFGMYLFLPVINKGIESLNKSELRMVFISIIFIFIIVKDYLNPNADPFIISNGNSVLWLLICYLTGAYFGKFKHDYHGIKKYIHYFAYIIVFYYSTILCYKNSNKPIMYDNGYFKFNLKIFLKNIFVERLSSVPMILQSICVLLLFTEIKYNKYLSKIITFIGPLTYGIYLIHDNVLIRENIIKHLFKNDPYNLPLIKVIKLVLLRGLKVFGICAFIDYLRHIAFTFLRIRTLCIFVEKIIFKIVNFF